MLLISCGSESSHTHTFASTWERDGTYHWHKSACGHDVVSGKEEHTFKEQAVAATYEEEGYTLYICEVCNYSYKDNVTEKLTHNYASNWSSDKDNHWHACTDEGYETLKKDEAKHTFKDEVVAPTFDKGGYTLYTCTVCDYSYKDNETAKLTHNYSSTWSHDEDNHWHACTDEGYETLKADEAEHTYKDVVTPATYEVEGYTTHTCTVCGYSYRDSQTSKLDHNYSSNWSHDNSSHWHACTDKGYENLKKDEATHNYKTTTIKPTYDADGYTLHTCEICSYSYKDDVTSKLTHTYASNWSSDKNSHWHACIDEGYETLKKDESSHSYQDVVTHATYEAGGYTTHICTVCDYSYVDNKIPSIKEKLGILPVIDEENNTLTYGLYPQTYVSDEATILALDALTSPESNGWYLYNDEYYTKKSANPYSSSYTFNDGTTIKSGTTYWFKCEPIKWKILTSSDGSYSLVSNVLIDTHIYDSDYNNYKDSEIRSWLNDHFLNSAFSLDSSLIQTTTVDNSASTTNLASNSYACANTEDKIYLLSYKDYRNSSYFSDNSARQCKPTDYALANYCHQSNGNGWYWTRSPASNYNDRPWRVVYHGGLDDYRGIVSYTNVGVRPAITINL